MNSNLVKGFRVKEEGLKGLTLKYSEFQTKDGVSYMLVRNDEYKRPVMGVLRDKVLKEVKPFVLYGLGIVDGVEVKNWLDRVRVLGADRDGDGWKIYAVLDCSGGIVNVGVPVNSEVEGFEGFEKLMDSVLEDIKKYVAAEGESLDVRQMAMDFADVRGERDKFDEMSEEEKLEWATKLLEKNGNIIISSDDMGWTPGEEVVAEVGNEEPVMDAQVKQIEVPKKKKKDIVIEEAVVEEGIDGIPEIVMIDLPAVD